MFKINLKKLKERINEGHHPTANEGMYLVAYIERLTRVIASLQWWSGPGLDLCPWCKRDKEQGHSYECEIGDIIRNSQGLLKGEEHELEQESKT